MGRLEESSRDDFGEATELGKANEKCIKEMHQWCKHFRIEMKSSGLYAQISGLPIGLHEISCPYTDCHKGASNLPWVCSDFLIEACDGCPHHEPSGDDSWGQKIISDHKERVRIRAEAERKRAQEVDRLRSELRAQSQSIGSGSKSESQRIAEFLEGMFSDDSVVQEQSAARLKQAAQVGADLFPESAIDLLINMLHYEEFNKPAIEICVELAERRTDLAQKFESAALDAIRGKRHPHLAADILVRLGQAATYPLDLACIKGLLLSQYHDVPIGNCGNYEPDYSATTEVLVRSYDVDQENFLNLLREYLQHTNDELRKHFCGAINLLQEKRPAVVKRVLPELMKSLERYEQKDITHGGPSGKIIKVFQGALRNDPTVIDTFLAENLERVRPTVQEDIIKIYRDQFFDRDLNWRDRRGREEQDISEAERVAISRLLKWIKNDKLEPEIREKTAEALDIACSHATDEIGELQPLLQALNHLITTYAQEAIFKGISTIPESKFHKTVLRDLGLILGSDVQNHPHQAGGIGDIRYRGVITELKVEKDTGDRQKIAKKYAAQTTQYQGIEARQVSVLLVLDLTAKDSPPGDLRNDILLVDVPTHGGADDTKPYPSKAIVVVINGNVKSPSDYSR